MRSQRRLVTALPVWANRMRSDLLMLLLDASLVSLSLMAILLIRDGGPPNPATWRQALSFLPVAIGVFLLVGWAFGVYRHVWRYASVYEARRLIEAGAVSMAVLCVVTLATHRQFGPRTMIASAALATLLMGAVRFQSRLFSRRRVEENQGGLRVVVVGAGQTGAALARQMLASPGNGLVPVCFVDDDPRRQGKQVVGVPVRGYSSDLADVIVREEAHQVLLAVPSAPRELVQSVAADAEATGVALRLVPSIEEIVRSGLRLQDVRQVRIDDLLGREQVVTDLAAVGDLIRGRRVLITGAGGSIGSEIAEQVGAFAPSCFLLLDHDETHLHDLSTTLTVPHECLLVDIRDRDRVVRAFEKHRPEVVFHAAAHKHVPILEDEPGEALRTNVFGTQHLIDAARIFGVDTFVLISTDKAVRPSSVMGASKRLAEHLVMRAAAETGARYTAVRFGNVLGSRGSVIPTFVRQIEAGGPVTVTDPRMTRYFMSIPEAVQLVLQAAALSEGAEVFMLEMGQPVRILDLAHRMIRLSGRRVGTDIEIRLIGARPGEKLQEELHAPEEHPQATTHPALSRLQPSVADGAAIHDALQHLAYLTDKGEDSRIRASVLDLATDPASWGRTRAPQTTAIDLSERNAWSRSTS
jgi:FlaA1/EpsC-like NDP-sugar epimerase